PVRHAPSCTGILLQRLQPDLLLFLREMKPELEDQRAFVREHFFEALDLIDALLHSRILDAAMEPVHDRYAVPGSEENADGAFGRKGPPEAPHRRSLPLFIGRMSHRV